MRDAERQAAVFNQKCAENEKVMEKFADEIRQLEVLMDRKAREHEALERDHRKVLSELEEYRLKDAKYSQVRISLEQET